MTIGGDDLLAWLEELKANLASTSEGRTVPSPGSSVVNTGPVVSCVPKVSSSTLIDMEKWDGEQKIFQLWWLKVQIWVQNML